MNELIQVIKSITNAFTKDEQRKGNGDTSLWMFTRPLMVVFPKYIVHISFYLTKHDDFKEGSKGGFTLLRDLIPIYGVLFDWLDDHDYVYDNLNWRNYGIFWLVQFSISQFSIRRSKNGN